MHRAAAAAAIDLADRSEAVAGTPVMPFNS